VEEEEEEKTARLLNDARQRARSVSASLSIIQPRLPPLPSDNSEPHYYDDVHNIAIITYIICYAI
jgi:hypothetical protein